MFNLPGSSRTSSVDRDVRGGAGAVPDNGIAVERREAPGPTLLGPRARKRQPLVTGDLPWRAPDPGFGSGTGGDPPVAPPGAPSLFSRGRKKGKGVPGSPKEVKSPGSMALATRAV